MSRITRFTDITDGAGAEPGLHDILPFEERYVRNQVLGRGGMGEVFLCTDRRIGRDVAVKVIAASHRDNEELKTRFLHEAYIQGQLEHPSVVPIYDLGVAPEVGPYFVMKRVRGTTLHAVLKALRDGDPEALQRHTRGKLLSMFRQLCLAIDYAHAHGVLHRDLKPSNVMLGDFGEVHVLDWGLAKPLSTPTREARAPTVGGMVLGTPGYMAPEQADRDREVDVRTDVYALGAILYEILTLRPLAPRSSDWDDDDTRRITGPGEPTQVADIRLTPELQEILYPRDADRSERALPVGARAGGGRRSLPRRR